MAGCSCAKAKEGVGVGVAGAFLHGLTTTMKVYCIGRILCRHRRSCAAAARQPPQTDGRGAVETRRRFFQTGTTSHESLSIGLRVAAIKGEKGKD